MKKNNEPATLLNLLTTVWKIVIYKIYNTPTYYLYTEYIKERLPGKHTILLVGIYIL